MIGRAAPIKRKGFPLRLPAWGLLLILAAGCGRAPDRPDIALISIDALRADALGCYGYGRDTTPFLDRLAGRGVVFRNCVSTSSWTRPAMASLMTGLYPRTHGVTTSYHKYSSPQTGGRSLVPSIETLAGVLEKAGYTTIGITTNSNCGQGVSIDRGFTCFTQVGEDFVDPAEVYAAFQAVREEVQPSGPVFLWVHFLDPHGPWTPRAPWAGTYTDLTAAGELADIEYQGKVIDEEIAHSRETVAILKAFYDSEVKETDRYLEKLLGKFAEDALVIVTADHGDEFYEHGQLEHGKTLFEEVAKVPLIVRFPGNDFSGREVFSRVSLVDVFPTILDFLSLPASAGTQGISLMPLLRQDREAGPDRLVFSEMYNPELETPKISAVYEGDWKLVRQVSPPRTMLFDLATDPEEKNDCAAAHPEIREKLEAALEEWEKSHPQSYFSGAPRPDEGELRQLKALGYIN